MADADEMIEFIRLLKRGFDKDVFECKINELADLVDTVGLENDDFHNLFKLWLNLSIPITKWTSLGTCLVPQTRVEERTIDYAFRWLLANCENHGNFSRMAFVLDWLTAAMVTDSIDMKALDSGYEIFYTLLSFEVLTAHVLKLVYTLTKPSDVTRKRVLELLELAKKREGKKNMLRQLQVLLGLFKSYRPECVPEDVPAISVHTSFKKININLMARFKTCQEKRNTTSEITHHLLWVNPAISEGGINKKAEPLVPSMEFTTLGSKQYDKEPQKNYLDFSDPVSMLQCSLQQPLARPSRVRALLCNDSGLTLLAVASHEDHAFLSHDLLHLLDTCFLEHSPHSTRERATLLKRLSALQHSLLQPVPVVSRFLAQLLPGWNERDYFGEIMHLVEWTSVDNALNVIEPLTRAALRATPLELCAILRALVTMYCNMVYSGSRTRQHFPCSSPDPTAHTLAALPAVSSALAQLCANCLQAYPEDMRVLFATTRALHAMRYAELRASRPAPATAATALAATAIAAAAATAAMAATAVTTSALPLALPLLTPAPLLLDKTAGLIILYKKLFAKLKPNMEVRKEDFIEQRNILQAYTLDVMNCLYTENAFSGRKSGYIFTKLHPQLLSKLMDLNPGADGIFGLRNNLAFAPYTFLPLEADPSDATNKIIFHTVVRDTFPNISEFLMKLVPELR